MFVPLANIASSLLMENEMLSSDLRTQLQLYSHFDVYLMSYIAPYIWFNEVIAVLVVVVKYVAAIGSSATVKLQHQF